MTLKWIFLAVLMTVFLWPAYYVYAQPTMPGTLNSKLKTSSKLDPMALAADLIKVTELDIAIRKNINSGLSLFKKVELQKLTEIQKKDLKAAKAKFIEMEDSLNQDVLEQVKKEMTVQFSAEELQYLNQVFQYSPVKRFKAFFTSPKVNTIMTGANEKTRKLIADAKIKIE